MNKMPKATYLGILKLTEVEWEQKKKENRSFRNCAVCGARLVMTLCRYHEDKYYCEEHCPEHKWQSAPDWPTECDKCGVLYTQYLEKLLDDNRIPYRKPGEK